MDMKILLVESNQEICTDIGARIKFSPGVSIVQTVETAEDAMLYLRENPVDAVLSNLMPCSPDRSSDGACLALFVAQGYPDVQIVLYGDFSRMIHLDFLGACTGLLEYPISHLAFQNVLNRLLYVWRLQRIKAGATNRSILVKTKEGYRVVALKDILFVERSERKNRIVLENGQEVQLYRYTLDELEQQLAGSGFYRCYQSFIVNLSKVAGIRADNEARNYTILFAGDKGEIMLSRSKYAEIVKLLQQNVAGMRL